MPVSAKIICDSISAINDRRVTTFEIECPWWVFRDLEKHHLFRTNASSTRAIPCSKYREATLLNPAIPTVLTKFQKGMEANTPLDADIDVAVRDIYTKLLNQTTIVHAALEKLELSKQDANIVLDGFSHLQAVVTGTEWKNFFALRCHHAAKPEMRLLAEAMRDAYESSKPEVLNLGEWHLPYVMKCDRVRHDNDTDRLKIVSTARCARVSYRLPGSNAFSSFEKDYDRFTNLRDENHWSPFFHQLMPMPRSSEGKDYMVDSFVGWFPHRKEFEGESGGDVQQVQILTGAEARDILKAKGVL